MNNIPLHKSKKLIGSMFGEMICMLTTLIKWYLQHGLIITKFYDIVTEKKQISHVYKNALERYLNYVEL